MLRSHSDHPFFGHANALSQSQLPTGLQVMRQMLYLQKQVKTQALVNVLQPTLFSVVSRSLIQRKYLAQWHNGNGCSNCKISFRNLEKVVFLLCHHIFLRKRVFNLFQINLKLLKTTPAYKVKEKHQIKNQSYSEKLNQLFDIAACKCKELKKCCCPLELRVPIMEHPYFEDERNAQLMVIGFCDVQTTAKLQRSQAKFMKAHVNSTIIKSPNIKAPNNSSADTPSTSKRSEDQDQLSPQNNQMRQSLSCLASACDRYMVSDRSAAAIASAILEDVGLIYSEDQTKVIDRNKIRRERGKRRENVKSKEVEITSLYFDGRKDKTMMVNGKQRRIVVE